MLPLLKTEDIIIKNEIDDDEGDLAEKNVKLTNKIEQARNLLKESINLCQQVFLQTDDSGKSLQFDNVVEPMVTALDLLTNTLNTLGDICQSEFKNADANFNEEFNDNFDNEDYNSEDSTKEGLIKIKKEKKTSRGSRKRKRVNYDEDYDPKKVTKKENPDGTKRKKWKKIIEYECDKCELKTENKLLHTSHVQGLLTFRKCPWCQDSIKTGEERKNRGRKSTEEHFKDHMTEKHPELCTGSTAPDSTPPASTAPDSAAPDSTVQSNTSPSSTLPSLQYICKLCGLQLSSFEEYDRHLTHQHNLGYNFHCKHNCGFSSTLLHVIKDHLKEVHSTYVFACSLCPLRHKSQGQLDIHIAECHTRVNCDFCSEEIESKKVLRRHLRQVHNQRPEDMISCSICGEEKSKKYLAKHMVAVHGNKDDFKCSECDYTTSVHTNLVNHIKHHHESKDFLCDLCPYVGGSKKLVLSHRKIHMEKTFCCKLCDFSTQFQFRLSKHMKLKHAPGGEVRPFKCDKCFKTFSLNHSLQYHMLTHDESNKMQCPEPDCNYETFHKEHLESHTDKEHKGIRYPCTKCEYIGNYKRNLNYHIRVVHEGIFQSCNECDFKCTKKYVLKQHIQKVHEGVTWPCSDCNYVANTRANFTFHIRAIHKGYQHRCDLCNYKSPYASNVTRHKELIHKIFKDEDSNLKPEIEQQE